MRGARSNELASAIVRINVSRNARATHVASALPRPEEPEAESVPGEDRLASCPPFVPDTQQPDPQHSVGLREPHSLRPQSDSACGADAADARISTLQGTRTPSRRGYFQAQ